MHKVRRAHRRDLREGRFGLRDSCSEPSAITVIGAAADIASEPVLPISVARSSIGGAWIFLMSAKPNPETVAMTQPTRITVPHNPAAMIANRRELMALVRLPYSAAKHVMALIFQIKK